MLPGQPQEVPAHEKQVPRARLENRRSGEEVVGIAGVDREHAHLVDDALALLLEFPSEPLERRVGDFDPSERDRVGAECSSCHRTRGGFIGLGWQSGTSCCGRSSRTARLRSARYCLKWFSLPYPRPRLPIGRYLRGRLESAASPPVAPAVVLITGGTPKSIPATLKAEHNVSVGSALSRSGAVMASG